MTPDIVRVTNQLWNVTVHLPWQQASPGHGETGTNSIHPSHAQVPLRQSLAEYLGTQVIPDEHARYFGVELNDQSLTPGSNPWIGPTRFEAWFNQSTRQK